MTSRDFCYWLQGFFELSHVEGDGLDQEQVAKIRAHLAMVFKHEIDLSHGTPEHREDLRKIHDPPPVESKRSKEIRELLDRQHQGHGIGDLKLMC